MVATADPRRRSTSKQTSSTESGNCRRCFRPKRAAVVRFESGRWLLRSASQPFESGSQRHVTPPQALLHGRFQNLGKALVVGVPSVVSTERPESPSGGTTVRHYEATELEPHLRAE